ncbi:DNA-protecting protein DprA [Anoxybacterium hadale]|uniref:DNA-protecting protein DprA n=1 Tax=Anoxybacterium hadale TaxID=3408580 RepID=A0ACD1A7Q7_9FIRM|nr:DNA-protecting protein DprA [Clostridiales bacterium]
MDKIKKVKVGEKDYPELLNYIGNPPEALYYQGDITLASEPLIAVVGARKASSYGKWAAYHLSEKLSEFGIGVVSGMAYGIDAYAHKGAVDYGGRTIAVLGCGVDICYPASNRALKEEILKTGLILSEYEPGVPPLPFRFPLRNRIISGLCIGTVVVEAGLNSGSLITAEYAAEQGRNIYAVPGNINNVSSFGANKLIKDGAVPLIVFDDIIDELGINRSKKKSIAEIELGEDEKKIYDYIRFNGESTTDEVCRNTGRKPSEINSMVTILEMKGLLQTALGKIFIAK